ncbi:hypothetical protein KJ781_00915, partial [Patescibacteria group bacterium]|nr:hypothetical protein [Patescibacteria group bacterium]MBU1448236.1 hypothetical protein [Patescibacteria group bacterium]
DAGFVLFTPLLALSTVIPLWFATTRWGRTGQAATLVGWLTFPTVMLYANRGLFPNLPVLCLAIWASWLISRRGTASLVVAGSLTGLAILIRPTEIVWVGVWVGMAYLVSHPPKTWTLRRCVRDFIVVSAPFVAIAAIGACLAWMTYGSPLAIGYQLRDPSTGPAIATAATQVSWFESWAFGFHPRNVWFNATSYLLTYLFPWAVLALVATVLAWKDAVERRWLYVAAWTVGVLCLIYGQGIYQDHVKADAVTLGNSFLRYLLPVAAIGALALGRVAAWIERTVPRAGFTLAILVVTLTASLGIWTATVRDDEGLTQDRIELLRYASIRDDAVSVLDPSTIVLSDRSDKIFFPAFRVASPLPPRERIAELVDTVPGVAVFIRTLDEQTHASWVADGFELVPLIDAGNETLYRVTTF